MAQLRQRTDFVEFLEAAYSCEPDERAWARQLTSVVQRSVEAAAVTGITAVAHSHDYVEPTMVMSVCTDAALDAHTAAIWRSNEGGQLRASPEVVRIFYPGSPYFTHRELEQSVSPQMSEWLRLSRAGAPDACAFFAYPTPGVAVVLWSALDSVRSYARGERAVLYRMAAHVDCAFRMRVSPEAVVAAVVSPTGKLLDVADLELAQDRGALAKSVVSIDRARLRAKRNTPEALNGWQALTAGRYSVVPREDTDGKRCYWLVHNGPLARDHARLAPVEVDVLSFAARGFTGKGTAYALGIGESTVSNALIRAAAKLGLRSRTALIQVAAAFFGVPSEAIDAATLSPAERDVLELVRRGLSNAEIAALRLRSQHTVANQISSILRKTGRLGRRSLYPFRAG